MEETLPTTELLSSSERFKTADEMVALHVRMAISGEALDPKKTDLPQVEAGQLINFDQTVKTAANGSVVDRINWWEKEWQKQVAKDASLKNLNEEQKAAKQKEIWVEEMIVDFKNTDNKDYVDRLKKRKIGEYNVAEMLKQQQLHELLQQAIQKQLDQQKAGNDIESVGLQFTPDNLLSVRIKAKKNK